MDKLNSLICIKGVIYKVVQRDTLRQPVGNYICFGCSFYVSGFGCNLPGVVCPTIAGYVLKKLNEP